MSKAPAATAPSVPKNRVLSARESLSFKSVLQAYESRQWKRGLKTADQILKKYPEHGETLSMKGLILTNVGRKEEGLELVRKGVRMDLTSHICWHVLGLVHKADRNYEEALKCYTQALKFDKENLNILRDAAHLQMQLRHFDQLVETRQTVLKYRANLRQSWIALAIAYHLNGQLDSARKVLEQYEATVRDVPPYDPEHSELLLYHVRILEELGHYGEALDFLVKNAKSRSIMDRSMIAVLKARLLQRLGRAEEAKEAWHFIIDNNPECYNHYSTYLSIQGLDLGSLTDISRTPAIIALHQLSARNPKAITPRRILLGLASGDEFRQLATTYFEEAIARGIPSLFSDLKDLYLSSEKRQVIEDIAERLYESTLENPKGHLPSSHIWTLYYLIQHHASRPSTIPRALELADRAIEHSPALPDLYMAKARALKRAGNPIEACVSMAAAWRLDLQDRFLNTKNAKYLLRAGYIDDANKILGLFTKRTASSPGADLEDMQSLFYMKEEGDAQARVGKLSLALKRYHMLFKTFDDIEDDQYDFHAYALRKSTITTYLQLIDMEDTLRSHPAYATAAIEIAKVYIRMHEDPKLASPPSGSSDSRKKVVKKVKKADTKHHEDPKKAPATSNADDLDNLVVKDDDPEGLKLLAVADPLESAWKRLLPLHMHQPKLLDTWLVSFDVAIRQKKYLQALKALKYACSLSPDHPEVHHRLVEFKVSTEQPGLKLLPPVEAAIKDELPEIFPTDVSPEAFNATFLQKTPITLPASALAAARALVFIRGAEAAKTEAEELVFLLLKLETEFPVQTGLDALEFLRTTLKSSRTDEFRRKCISQFPLSCVFQTDDELIELRDSALKLLALEEPQDERTEVVDIGAD